MVALDMKQVSLRLRSALAFTLIEFLVVIAVIAILAGLLFAGIVQREGRGAPNSLPEQPAPTAIGHAHVLGRE
jgi:prepilin-type N-terminal cleavage/methylation domain-containing protein